MNNLLNDETFLARWLAGDLSEKEIQLFQQHPDFSFYQQVAKESANLRVPEIDEAALLKRIKIQQKVRKSSPGKQRFLNKRLLSIAATLLFLIIGYALFFRPSESTLKTQIGEQLMHLLPEGSSILLNTNSSLTYQASDFKAHRTLELKGEAFFEVSKGEAFTVQTTNGTIDVLGTSFSVYSRTETLIVACKTGSVRVKNNKGQSITLSSGERVEVSQAILQSKQKINPETIAGWNKGVSNFDSESLEIVSKAVENQFGISIQLAAGTASEKFTGSFLHTDIDTALKMVFTSMGMEYTKVSNGTYMIK